MPYVPVPVLGPAGGSHSPESLWPNRKRAREAQRQMERGGAGTARRALPLRKNGKGFTEEGVLKAG